jgi:LPXTG-motif cell wall-anchored protein
VTATDNDGATSTVASGTVAVGSTAPPLPRTGSSTAVIFLVAAALVVLGALLAAGARFVRNGSGDAGPGS